MYIDLSLCTYITIRVRMHIHTCIYLPTYPIRTRIHRHMMQTHNYIHMYMLCIHAHIYVYTSIYAYKDEGRNFPVKINVIIRISSDGSKTLRAGLFLYPRACLARY